MGIEFFFGGIGIEYQRHIHRIALKTLLTRKNLGNYTKYTGVINCAWAHNALFMLCDGRLIKRVPLSDVCI